MLLQSVALTDPRDTDDPMTALEGPAPAPAGWLNLGAGFGIPAFWTLACLTVVPVVVYVISYIPWAFVGGDQLFAGCPTGQQIFSAAFADRDRVAALGARVDQPHGPDASGRPHARSDRRFARRLASMGRER